MNFEHASAHAEKASKSHEAVAEIAPEDAILIEIGKDMKRLSLDGSEVDHLLQKLPVDDAVAVEAREQQSYIRARVGSILQNAALSLSLLVTPQPVHGQEGAPAAPEHTRPHVELEYDNPQRVASSDARTYKIFLRDTLKQYKIDLEHGDFTASTSIPENLQSAIQGYGVVPQELWTLSQQEMAQRKIEEIKQELKSKDAYLHTSQSFPEADAGRQWVADLIHSPEYEQKAHAEGLSDAQIAERQHRVRQDKTSFLPLPESHLGEAVPDHNIAPKSARNTITLDLKQINREKNRTLKEVSIHEVAHHITSANEGLSQKAINLYRESFQKTGEMYDFYFSNPTEIDARKKEFEHMLEQLTDWRYGEPFTSERALQVRKLLEDGKLGEGSKEFLESIKPEYLERIMNELADTDEPTKNARTA